MITNERQLQIARRDIERFEEVLDGDMAEAGVHPTIVKAQREAVESQLNELRADVEDYLKLRSGKVREFRIDSLAELPRALISCRIASGMTQRELADRLSLKEQQIQRYEMQNYSGASFARIADVADAVGIELPRELKLAGADSPEAVLKRAAVAGVDSSFVRRRIAPAGGARAVAERIGYVFDWDAGDLFSKAPLELPATGGATARFKMPRRRNERNVAAYTVYAHRLAQICAAAMPRLPTEPIPDSAQPMIDMILRRGEINFTNALEIAWDLGIVVLPLSDSGQFHGAHWRIEGTNVIVLKQGERSISKWLIDLLHEMFHAARFPELPNNSVVEEPETSEHRREDPEELQATWYAALVATRGQAEDLFKRVHAEAGGDLRRFKSAVARVATSTNVDVGVLANYVAFRLSLQDESWWGAAANLQDRSVDPVTIARDAFFRRFDFSKLDETGFELLQLALNDEVHDG
ncbi:MAG: DNA (cytosine-5-)-methyltransferase [Pseudomonadota bacterium]|jgi:transcriptional regulator with XRE-family HTH domain|nr:DNA (cytosine-5-)-methyltransferase [Pseudomonadota bacterium]